MLFTRKKIKNPLKDIIKASIAVSKGDRSTRLKVKPNQLNDMKMVSSAFNNMLDNLQTATEELKNWSQQLEYKVQKNILIVSLLLLIKNQTPFSILLHQYNFYTRKNNQDSTNYAIHMRNFRKYNSPD